ncbi:MAG: hypothetical protein U0163_00790 [Gemmatimonadaceae bacterium]
MALACLGSSAVLAQEPAMAFPPPSPGIRVTTDVPYGTSGGVALKMDIFHPPGTTRRTLPALVFFNRATEADRSKGFWGAWARMAASRGLVAVIPDLRDGSEADDARLLVRHLAEHGTEVGLDTAAIAVYAASGNVYTAFPMVEDPAMTAIKAAVMYYGTGPVRAFRLDLPVLYVRAGLDRPDLNKGITALAAEALAQNAPVTLLNHSSGHHAFELLDNDEATRNVIELTLEFVKRSVAPQSQLALRNGLKEATAAGYVQTGDFKRAAAVFADLLSTRPDDTRLRLSYGEALLGDAQYVTACAEFEKLKGKGLGPRDLGLPAARACMLKGDADAAIVWLKSIPSRFLPPDVAKEAVFASIQERPDFRALFDRK